MLLIIYTFVPLQWLRFHSIRPVKRPASVLQEWGKVLNVQRGNVRVKTVSITCMENVTKVQVSARKGVVFALLDISPGHIKVNSNFNMPQKKGKGRYIALL